jgi:cytosine/adenosine deaminase-related metal-dependent hydrolase
MPRTLLARNADVLVTMDADRREIRNGGLLIEDNRIVAVDTVITVKVFLIGFWMKRLPLA